MSDTDVFFSDTTDLDVERCAECGSVVTKHTFCIYCGCVRYTVDVEWEDITTWGYTGVGS